jgi:uncharacterized membrane protein
MLALEKAEGKAKSSAAMQNRRWSCPLVHQREQASSIQRRTGERGAGRLKAIVVTVIIAFLVLVVVKTVPPYVAEYQLSDKMDETARFATVNSYNENQIRDTVYQTVRDLSIPVKKDDIKVEATRSVVKISVDYTVPVDLLFYHTSLHFTPSAENRSIY